MGQCHLKHLVAGAVERNEVLSRLFFIFLFPFSRLLNLNLKLRLVKIQIIIRSDFYKDSATDMARPV